MREGLPLSREMGAEEEEEEEVMHALSITA